MISAIYTPSALRKTCWPGLLLNSWHWLQEGPFLLSTVTLPLPWMRLLYPSLLKPSALLFSSSFSADDCVSCVLKMKAITRKPLHVSLHLRHTLHFLLCCDHCLCSHPWFLIPFLLSRTLHCFSIHPFTCLPVCCICSVSHLYWLCLSAYRYTEMLPIFKNSHKKPSPTPHLSLATSLQKNYFGHKYSQSLSDPYDQVFSSLL